MKVWAVREKADYEFDDVSSLWSTEDAAIRERDRLAGRPHLGYADFSVEEMEVND